MKRKKKQLNSLLRTTGILVVIGILSVVIMMAYSVLMDKYREGKIFEQIYQNVTTLKSLLQTQNDYKMVNTSYYQNKWSVIPDNNIPYELYHEIFEGKCGETDRYHEGGARIVYCDKLLFGKDFVPAYAYADYREFQNIYGGENFILLGKSVCKKADGNRHICAFIRFYDLPKDVCAKVASYDWKKIGVAEKRINEIYQLFFNIMTLDFAVNDEVNMWKDGVSLEEAKEICNRPNNWIDFIIYKD